MTKKNPHWGTTLDEFLGAEGIREAAKAEAVTRMIAWQLTQEMGRQGISGDAGLADAHQQREP
jgi:antitoxin HicB